MYRITFKKSAVKEIRLIPKSFIQQIIKAIDGLAKNPRPYGCKKLKGKDQLWRIRVGDYRVVYAIADVIEIIEIIRIRHRKEVYKR